MDLTKETPGYDKTNRGLELTARLANLMGLAGVPASHVHLAVVAHDQALDAMLDDAAYKAIHGINNPNGALLHALHQAGVELLVCGQTMAHRHLQASQLAPDIRVSLSALTTVLVYQQRGYSVLAP
jgi:intracellular sulfur oxidation DsrE/DsrF family protein